MSMYIGMVLYDYCEGRFGRDSYGDKRIEAIGHDWVVVREEDGTPNFTSFKSNSEMTACFADWSQKPDNL